MSCEDTFIDFLLWIRHSARCQRQNVDKTNIGLDFNWLKHSNSFNYTSTLSTIRRSISQYSFLLQLKLKLTKFKIKCIQDNIKWMRDTLNNSKTKRHYLLVSIKGKNINVFLNVSS